MEFIFDKKKAEKLLAERGIDMDKVIELLEKNEYIAMLENKSRPEQNVFVVRYKGYIHAIPFIYDANGTHVIKTVYPSRKHNKIYGDKK